MWYVRWGAQVQDFASRLEFAPSSPQVNYLTANPLEHDTLRAIELGADELPALLRGWGVVSAEAKNRAGMTAIELAFDGVAPMSGAVRHDAEDHDDLPLKSSRTMLRGFVHGPRLLAANEMSILRTEWRLRGDRLLSVRRSLKNRQGVKRLRRIFETGRTCRSQRHFIDRWCLKIR